ncbi:hypothetical protein BDZ91DRAFT_760559 [Kalaharituber pfeilii]|nr:hypothetical protein BDZ91DRAFT_760559 [Kalaharituber pfeilii]
MHRVTNGNARCFRKGLILLVRLSGAYAIQSREIGGSTSRGEGVERSPVAARDVIEVSIIPARIGLREQLMPGNKMNGEESHSASRVSTSVLYKLSLIPNASDWIPQWYLGLSTPYFRFESGGENRAASSCSFLCSAAKSGPGACVDLPCSEELGTAKGVSENHGCTVVGEAEVSIFTASNANIYRHFAFRNIT